MMKKLLLFFVLYSVFVSNVFPQSLDSLQKREIEIKKEIEALTKDLESVKDSILKLKSQKILNKISEQPILSIAQKGAYLKAEPNIDAEIIWELEEEKPVQVFDRKDDYYQVCIEGKCGFMAEAWIKENEALNELDIASKEKARIRIKAIINRVNAEQEKIEQEAIAEKAADRKAENDRMLRKYGKNNFEKMKNGHFWIGMNKEMVLFALGSPLDINKSIGTWGVHEQWVYGNGFYLYFENGKLTSYQR